MQLMRPKARFSFLKTPGGTSLYKLYRYVPTQRIWFLGLFGPKTGTHFAHFGLESGMVYERTTGVYEGQVLKNRAAHPHEEFPEVPSGLKRKQIA